MLLLGSTFEKMPVLSLRSSCAVGRVVGHLINPHKLKIDAIWCHIGGIRSPQLILSQDIREVSPRGVIVDDHAVAIAPEEAIRLKPIIDLSYEILGKKVVSGRLTIGKATDYAIDRDTFMIQKIYANPNMWGMLKTAKLTIDRSQVIEVSPSYIRINDSRVTSRTQQKALRKPQLTPSASAAASASVIDE